MQKKYLYLYVLLTDIFQLMIQKNVKQQSYKVLAQRKYLVLVCFNYLALCKATK